MIKNILVQVVLFLKLTFTHVNFVDQSRKDVSFFQVEIVGRSKHVGGHNSGELGSVVLVEALVQNVDHSLCVRVPVVGCVRGSVVDLLYK